MFGRFHAVLTVYPRVCGGTVGRRIAWGCYLGLSPRVRGNPELIDMINNGAGSIPACAGEPRPQRREPREGQVYPRVCGGTSIPSPSP